MTKFDKSLRFGQALEQRLLDRLLVPFRDAVRVFGKDSRCDIKIPELDITIEVKSDITSRDTGNIVVEYFHNAPSGILKSTADYWMFDTGVEEIWISRQRIVLCILVEQLSPAKIHGADDRHPKLVYLIPRQTLVNYSFRVRALDISEQRQASRDNR